MFAPFFVTSVLLGGGSTRVTGADSGWRVHQNVNYFKAPGFTWTDWGWDRVRSRPSDDERRAAGAERLVRELGDNNGTEATTEAIIETITEAIIGEVEEEETTDATEQDLIIETTPASGGADEEVIIKLIEDNENEEKQLADSLEEVINNLSEIVDEVTTIEASASDDSSENARVGGDASETTTPPGLQPSDDLSADVQNGPEDRTQESIVRDFITQQALERLNGANLTEKDMKILTALLELETLKGEQKDTKEEIDNKLLELETLLDAGDSTSLGFSFNIENVVSSSLSSTQATQGTQKPRRGKTAAEFQAAASIKSQTVNLFQNIQKQLFLLLDERHKFLRDVSDRINSELSVIQQTVSFLQQLVNLKLDQGILLLGADNPLLKILQTGSTSVFLTLTKFFQAVESVLAMRDQFLRIFSFDSTAIQETRLLERIQELKINKILPTKIRFLVNVHANSDKLGALLEQMFACIGQIVEAKVEVIESVGKFFENKIKFLSGLNGGGRNPQEIVEAVASGNLFDLLNLGPVHQAGLPVISDQELEKQVEEVLRDTNPRVPVLGPAKPLLVDHRVLGVLAGRDRERFVNRYLARRLARLLATSSSVLDIRRGQTVLQSSLRPLSLGTPCTNDIHLGGSHMTAVVTRSSRLSATLGPTIHSHSPVSLDLIGNARLYTSVATSGHINAKFGHKVFGKCFSKFSGSSPYSLAGAAVVDAHVKVVVRRVRIETRAVRARDVLTPLLARGRVGEPLPHLVFNFNIKVDGTVVNFDVTKLKLSGCELKLLGFKMFSHCDLLEGLIRRQMEKMMQDTFPLRDPELLYKLQKMIKRRLGEEIAIPLILSDLASTDKIEKLIRKTGELIDLNIQFFNLLAMFTQDMQKFNTLEERSLA